MRNGPAGAVAVELAVLHFNLAQFDDIELDDTTARLVHDVRAQAATVQESFDRLFTELHDMQNDARWDLLTPSAHVGLYSRIVDLFTRRVPVEQPALSLVPSDAA